MNRSTVLPVLAAAAFAAFASSAAYVVDGIARDRFVEEARSSLLARLSTKRAKLESALTARIQLGQSIVPYELNVGPLSQTQFSAFARSLMEQQPGTIAIALLRPTAPNARPIAPLVYPNNIATQPLLDNYAQQQQRFKQKIPNGLIVQLPQAYTNRSRYLGYVPVCDGRCSSRNPVRGTVIVVFDELALLAEADLLSADTTTTYALYERLANGNERLLVGSAEVFDRNPVMLEIPLLTGRWQLAAVPTQGWTVVANSMLWLRLGEGAAIGLGTLLTFVLVRQPLRLRVAIDQTRETNRLLREEILDRQLAETKLQTLTEQLEQHVNERTAELSAALDQVKRAQVQVVQSEKMSSLGQLVAGVAHEINNPVNFIYGNLTHTDDYTKDLLKLVQLYRSTYPEGTETINRLIEDVDLDFLVLDLPKMLQSMHIGAERIKEIVQSLRSFSRMDEAEMKAVNLHEGIDSTLTILNGRMKARNNRLAIEVVRHYGSLPLVECYPGQLNQVFMNLIANAIDALEERDRQRSMEQMQARPSQITITTERSDDWAIVRITDNGPGIPQEVQQRLFDPFYTTKPVGKGTGLGLSISYQIVAEKHGGTIACTSSPGYGSTFMVSIPLRQLDAPS